MLVTAPRDLTVTCRLDPEPVQVGHAREQVRKALPGWGLDEHTELAEIIISELVTNAMLHGDGQIDVRLSCASGHLQAEVHDNGPGRPVRYRPASDDERGRGLELIDGLIEQHGGARGVVDDSNGPGKTVYVTVCIPRIPASAR